MRLKDLNESKYFTRDQLPGDPAGHELWNVTWERMRADQVIMFEGTPVEAISHHAGDPHLAVRFMSDELGSLRMDELVPIGEDLDLKLARAIDGNTYELIESI